MKRIKLYEEFINERREDVGKYNTVKKAVKAIKQEYGPTPTEQSVASFITDNYYDVTEVERGNDDPAANDKIADLVAFYKFDIEDWEIAWADAQNESVQEKAITPKDSKVTVDDYTTENGIEIKASEIVGAMVSHDSEDEFKDFFYDQYGIDAFTEADMSKLVTYFNEYLEEIKAEETEEEEKEKQEEEGGEESADDITADL